MAIGRWKFFAICLLISMQTQTAIAKLISGILGTEANWHFLARFCFASEYGALKYEISYPEAYAPEKLLLYYDSASQWPAVYKKPKSCSEKESVLLVINNQIITLTPHNSTSFYDDYAYQSYCGYVMRGDQQWISCQRTIRFLSSRERWWFIAVSNCNTSIGLYMEYKLTMTNGNPGDFWFYHFSYDEFYILPTDIGFLFLECCTFAICLAFAALLRARQMLHVTYKLFMVSHILDCLSLTMLCAAYGVYARDGLGLPFCKLAGEMFNAAGILIFILLLVLIGKGYTVTRGRMSQKSSIKLSVFMAAYTLTYAALFIYQARFFDPGEVTYLYESPAGYGLVALRLVGWAWFWYAIYFTLKHYPEKRRFYVVFAIVYSIWFVAGPCIIIIANNFIGKWMREKIVNSVEKAVNFSGYALFLFITRPSAANATFPYHVRTSQITAMEQPGAPADSSLPHNAYEFAETPENVDVFTVQRARTNPPRPNPSRPWTRRANTNDNNNNNTRLGVIPEAATEPTT